MEIQEMKDGRYIIAVSGGVDSMVLLDLLHTQSGQLELIVAHYNHGIRPNANQDEEFVENAAKKYNLAFESEQGNLGRNTSEQAARNARYVFLRGVRDKYKASGIITAHHQDDLIETAVINVIRGTGRKGMTAISNNPGVLRPLLATSKASIIKYARDNDIKWREDETNQEERYLRNLIRKKLETSLTDKKRKEVLNYHDKVAKINNELDQIIAKISRKIIIKSQINRLEYISLPHDVGKEVIMWWLTSLDIGPYERQQIERLDMALRSANSSTTHQIIDGYNLFIATDSANITTPN